MGNACCRPPAGDGGAEAVSKAPGGGRTAAVSLGGGQGLHRPSLGWYSATDGYDGCSEEEEEWHDALSEIDLAEALEGWEEEANWHDAEVDSAIQVPAAAASRAHVTRHAWPGLRWCMGAQCWLLPWWLLI